MAGVNRHNTTAKPILKIPSVVASKTIHRKTDHPFQQYTKSSCDPLENFYEHACGHYDLVHTIPADGTKFDLFRQVEDELQVVVTKLLTSGAMTENQPYYFSKVMDAYNSCTNEQFYKADHLPELQLVRKFGGMSLIDHKPTIKFGWLQIAQLSAQTGVPLILDVDVNTNCFTGSDKMIMVLSHEAKDYACGSESIRDNTDEYAFNQAIVHLGTCRKHSKLKNFEHFNGIYENFFKHLSVRLALTYFNVVRHIEIEEDLHNVLMFHQNLIKLQINHSFEIDPFPDNRVTVDELQLWTHTMHTCSLGAESINWAKFLNIFFEQASIVVKPNQILRIPGGAVRLCHILKLIGETPPSIIKNYALLKVMFYMAFDSHPDTARLRMEHRSFGEPTSRTQHCLWTVMDYRNNSPGLSVGLVPALLSITPPHALQTAKELFEKLKASYISLLRDGRNKYIAPTAAKAFISKLQRIRLQLGWPSFLVDKRRAQPNQPNRLLKRLRIKANDAYGNAQRIRAYKKAYLLAALAENSTSDAIWSCSPFAVNAQYIYATNTVVLPLGLIYSTHFNPGYSAAIRFGRLGAIIGHEIGHMFDSCGLLYDNKGRCKPWLSNEFLIDYHTKLQTSLLRYYAQLSHSLLWTDRKKVDENMADQFGVGAAFYAFDRPENAHKRKAFFYSYATMWCIVQTAEQEKRMLGNRHSSSEIRVRATLTNFEPFRTAFAVLQNRTVSSGRAPYWQLLWS